MPKTIVSDAAFDCELHDEVAIVQLKRSAMRIVLDLGVRDKYLNMLDELAVDPNVSGMIVFNKEAFLGKTEVRKFLKRMIEDSSFQNVIAVRFGHSLSQIVSRRLNFPKPIVAGVAGPVTMEVFGAYLMSDRLIATDHFSIRNIGLPLGLLPGPILTFLLPRILGPRKAFKLLTEDDTVNAPEALDLGLVDKIVPEAKFEQECRAEMQRLVGLPSPVVSATRQLIFSEFDKFQDHADRSTRQLMQNIESARRQ